MRGKHSSIDNMFKLITGIFMGAGAMWLMDPQNGKRRQALVKDKTHKLQHDIQKSAEIVARDMQHRLQGTAAQARSLWNCEQNVDDNTLEARVRAKLGRVVSHPGAIKTSAVDGQVTLTGVVTETEYGPMGLAIEMVPGVKYVNNLVTPIANPETHPSLQGGRTRHYPTTPFSSPNWTPTTRFIVGATGLLIMRRGRKLGFLGLPLTAMGALLTARSSFNEPIDQIKETVLGHQPIQIEKTMEFNVSVQTMYDFWSNLENLGLWMKHIKVVRMQDDKTSRWIVDGPGGSEVSWQAQTTKQIPNQLIAWHSLEGSTVENWGEVRFEEMGENRCRIHVQMVYSPPGGMLGHAFAALTGKDPKSQMNDDFNKLKTLIEHGESTVQAAG